MLRLCAKVDKVDDLLMYGYKLLGKNKAGQNVYRQVVENPINRGFLLRRGYPETFQATSFAYVDDAGKVTDQFVRKVGTVGASTNPERINIAEFAKLNIKKGQGFETFHMAESTPKAGKFHVWEEKVNPKKGIEWQKLVYNANNQGKLENAIMQVEYKSPLAQGNIKGWYNIEGSYVRNPEATIRQNGVKKAPYQIFPDSPKYEPCGYTARAPIGEIKYPHNIAELKKPGFYRQYAGPLERNPGVEFIG